MSDPKIEEAVVLKSAEAGVITLTINRPAALNALNEEVLTALEGHIAEVATDASARVLILTGAGGKSFVAGADISRMQTMGPAEARAFAGLGHRVMAGLEALAIPVIAAVNGFCLGGGCELALGCDLIYASEKARFGQPEVNLGLIPGFGGTQRLPRRVGPQRAAELILTGRMVKALEAKAIGLCLEIFAPDQLMAEVQQIAATIASKGPEAVRLAKRVMQQGAEASLATGNALEAAAFANLFDTADTREGLTAFLEKRPAQFTDGQESLVKC